MDAATEGVEVGATGNGRIDRLFQLICGHPREFGVHHQVLNWLAFFGAGLYVLSGVENTLLGITPTWPMFLAGAAIAFCYFLVRVKRTFVRPLAVISLVLWLAMDAAAWFGNNGLAGSTPIFMLTCIVFLTVFQRPWSRALAIGLWLLEFAVLAALQIIDPASVMPYSSAMVGYIDMAFSISVMALYLIGYVVILSYNLEQRRQQSEELLLNILPRAVAEQLQYHRNQIVAEHIPNASVLFADVAGFTPLSAGMPATDLVELLDEVFTAFDRLVEQRGLEKIKTIGDCYMVAAGVPEPRADHASVLADLALAMQAYVSNRTFKGKGLTFRIGINSGPVVAGVIGRKKFIYDLWGDTVNTASRMESTGVPGRIQITEATRQLIEDEFCCDLRGTIPVKGKGEMPVWFVTSRTTLRLSMAV